jgi:hypothetical protein
MYKNQSLLPRTRWLSLLAVLCASYFYTLITPLFLAKSSTAEAASLPISVRFVGKMYLAPAGEKGRHRDLLPLELDAEQIVYLQVDSFHTSNREQGELILFSDMQRRRPPIRVINGDMLAALLTEEMLRGKQIAINGYFYRNSGLLWIAATHVKE